MLLQLEVKRWRQAYEVDSRTAIALSQKAAGKRLLNLPYWRTGRLQAVDPTTPPAVSWLLLADSIQPARGSMLVRLRTALCRLPSCQ